MVYLYNFIYIMTDAITGSNIQHIKTTTNVDVQNLGYIIGADPLWEIDIIGNSESGNYNPLILVRFTTKIKDSETNKKVTSYHTQFMILSDAALGLSFDENNYSIMVHYIPIQSN